MASTFPKTSPIAKFGSKQLERPDNIVMSASNAASKQPQMLENFWAKNLGLPLKGKSLITRLKEFLEIFDSDWNWKLMQMSDGQIHLKPAEAKFLLKKLSFQMESEQDRLFCDSALLDSVLTFRTSNTSQELISSRETHHIKSPFQKEDILIYSQSASIKQFPHFVGKILHSWKHQFLILQCFLRALVQFLEVRHLKVARLSLDCVDYMALSIGKVELFCHLMPQTLQRPLITVKFPGANNIYFIGMNNFRTAVNSVLVHFGAILCPPSPTQILEARQQSLQKTLVSCFGGNKFWSVVAAISDCQWKVSPMETYRPLQKIASFLTNPEDEELFRSLLDSTLLIAPMEQSNSWFVSETHQLRQRTNEIENLHWVHRVSDGMLILWMKDLLESWSRQVALIDIFLTQLAELLQAKRLPVTLKYRLKKHLLRCSVLEVCGTKMHCFLIPHKNQQRPLVMVKINNDLNSFRLTDETSVTSFFDSFTSKCVFPKKLTVPIVVKRKRKIPPMPTMEMEAKSSKQSEPLALMEELKSILTMDDGVIVTDMCQERTIFQKKVQDWVKNGYDVVFQAKTNDCYIVTAAFRSRILNVKFKQLDSKSKVTWALRLDFDNSQWIRSSGVSRNFYQLLIACLQRFLEQQLESLIVVEVKVEEPEAEKNEVKEDSNFLRLMNNLKEEISM